MDGVIDGFSASPLACSSLLSLYVADWQSWPCRPRLPVEGKTILVMTDSAVIGDFTALYGLL